MAVQGRLQRFTVVNGCLNRTNTLATVHSHHLHGFFDKGRGDHVYPDALEQESQQRQGRISGQLQISAPLHISQFGFQRLLSDFMQQHPQVTISWLLLNRYVNLVEEGIDLAIRVGHLPDSSLIALPLGEMSVYFVASPDYLAEQGEPQHPRQLNQHRCVIDSGNRQPGRFTYIEANRVQHLSVEAVAEVNNGAAVARFAADGVGIAQLPDFLVQPLIEQGQLQPILRGYEPVPIPVSLVYPGNRLISPALKALIEEIRNKAHEQAIFNTSSHSETLLRSYLTTLILINA